MEKTRSSPSYIVEDLLLFPPHRETCKANILVPPPPSELIDILHICTSGFEKHSPGLDPGSVSWSVFYWLPQMRSQGKWGVPKERTQHAALAAQGTWNDLEC